MADQLVYWARRHARPLTEQNVKTNAAHDWVEWLANNPKEWQHWNGPLDRVARLSARSTRRWPLVRLNSTFFPEKRHRLLNHWRAAGSVSALMAAKIHLAHSAFGSSKRAETRAALAWALENIRLPMTEKQDILRLLNTHP